MSNYPLVSVCIPVYNGAEFIPSLLNSIQNFNYPNLEIIISDDNSEDETLNLLKAAKASNWRIFTHPRYGLVPNWNYCISQAKGKYVKFLFQDDTLTPECITKMVEVAERDEGIGLVFSPRHLIYEETVDLKFLKGMENLHEHWFELKSIQSGLNLLQDRKFFQPPYNKIGEPTNVLIRRQAFEKLGTFDPDFKQLPDLEMWLRIMTEYKIAFINEKLATFRIHRKQTTSQNLDRDKIETLFEIYKVWLKIVFNKNYQTIPAELRQKMQRELIKILLIKGIKSILLLRWVQSRKVASLLRQAIGWEPNFN